MYKEMLTQSPNVDDSSFQTGSAHCIMKHQNV